MNTVKDYTSAINRFWNKIDSMIKEDFPEDRELGSKIDNSLSQVQFSIFSAFIERSSDKKG